MGEDLSNKSFITHWTEEVIQLFSKDVKTVETYTPQDRLQMYLHNYKENKNAR